MSTRLATDLTADEPIAFVADYQIGTTEDRRKADDQIVELQRKMVANQIRGQFGSYFLVSSISVSIVAGDCLCVDGETPADESDPLLAIRVVTKADAAAMAAAGAVVAVALEAANPGGFVRCAVLGILGPSITGLAPGDPGPVGVDANGRCARLPIGGVGYADPQGNLSLSLGSYAAGTGGSLPNVSTDRLLGRDSPGTGLAEEIQVGGGIEFTGSLSIRTTAFTGDVTKTAGGTALTIEPNVVTNAKFRQSVGTSVVGRAAGTTGNVADIVAGADNTFLGRIAGVLAFTAIVASMPDIASDRLWGRDSPGTGPSEQIAVAGGIEFDGAGSIQTSAFTGDVAKAAGGTSLTIQPNAVTNTHLRDSAAFSVIGRASGTSGDPADIVATSGQALYHDGTNLVFGVLPSTSIGAVATDRLLGRDTAGTGAVEQISVGGGIEFTGSLSIQTSAFTGDVTKSAGGTVLTIGADKVLDTMLRNSAALSVIGRSVNSTGDPGDITVTVDGHVLRLSGSTLGFGTIATAGIGDSQITFPKLQDIATDRLLGRDTAGTGVIEQLTVTGGVEFTGSGGIQRSALTGDVTAPAGSNTTTIGTNVVTFGKFQQILTDRILGRDTAGTGNVEELSVSGGIEFTGVQGIQTSAFTGDVSKTAGGTVLTIGADKVLDTMLRNSVANSVIGRSANSTGDPADIQATVDGTVLRLSGATLGFGTIVTAGIGDSQVTLAKIQDIATDRILGRDTAGTGVVEQLTVSGGLEFTGSTGIQRSALTGDVTASAGSNATTIANNAVTDAKLRDSSGLSVIGRSANTSGDPADIVAANDAEVLRRSGTAIGFGTIATAGIGNNQVTLGKIQQITTDRLLGRDTAATGDVEQISLNATLEFTGSTSIQRAALTGDITASAGSNATVFRDAPGLTLLARTANTTGPLANFTASVTNTAPYYNGTALVFGVLPSAAVSAAGSTGQVQYNNAGAFDGASGVTVVGSETGLSLAFAQSSGTNPATAGLLRAVTSTTIIASRNVGNTANMTLLSTDSANSVIFGEDTNVPKLVYRVATSGTYEYLINNTIEWVFDASTLATQGNSVSGASFFGGSGTVAGAGLLRGAHGGTIVAARNQGNTADAVLVAFGSGANNRLTHGDTNVVEQYFNIATSGTYVLQINSATEYTFSATTLDAQGNSVSNAAFFSGTGTVPASGLLRAATGVVGYASRHSGGTDAPVISYGVSATDEIRIGHTATTAGIEARIATTFNFEIFINDVLEWSFTQSALDAKANNVTNVGFFSASGTVATTGTVRGGDTFSIYGTKFPLDRALLDWSGDLLTLGDNGNAETVLRSVGHVRAYVNSVEAFDIESTGDADLLALNVSDASAKRLLLRGPGSTSGNTAGGVAVLRGGKRAGTGSLGGARMELNKDDSVVYPLVQIVDLGNENRRVVGLACMEPLNTTLMPSNTGDGVVYFADVQVKPTASATSGQILYADDVLGAMRVRGKQGQITSFSLQPVGSLTGFQAKHQTIHVKVQIPAATANHPIATIDLASLVVGSGDVGIFVDVRVLAYNNNSSAALEGCVSTVLVQRRSGTWAIEGTDTETDFTSDTNITTFGIVTSTSLEVRVGNDHATRTREAQTFIDYWIAGS